MTQRTESDKDAKTREGELRYDLTELIQQYEGNLPFVGERPFLRGQLVESIIDRVLSGTR